MRRIAALIAFSSLFTSPLYCQCNSARDHRSAKNGGIVIEQMILNGTQAIDSSTMAGITSQFVGACYDDNAEGLSMQVLDQLQQRGYFRAKVSNLSIKMLDPLASVKPTKVEAEVNEGPLYKLGELNFIGNHAFTTEELRAKFPFKAGQSFNSNKVRSGLEALRELYGSQGYVDVTPIPGAPVPDSGGTLALMISIDEGKQYRMGKLDIIGQSQTADLLKTRWSMAEGAVFDMTYVDKFIEENKSLLPEDFQPYKSVLYTRNCKEQTLSVVFLLESRPGFQQPPSEVGCEAPARQNRSSNRLITFEKAGQMFLPT
ncbi:MAG TPA: POTRA domain-containing protein [Terriglobales bacterium]|nr:POTRA domain-containing protein [Terriglobales bacterium]